LHSRLCFSRLDQSTFEREICQTSNGKVLCGVVRSYPQLTTYFYSNLSILNPIHIQFTVCEKVFDVAVDLLIDILEVERS